MPLSRFNRYICFKLYPRTSNPHSVDTFFMPRNRNLRYPWLPLICPNTVSTSTDRCFLNSAYRKPAVPPNGNSSSMQAKTPKFAEFGRFWSVHAPKKTCFSARLVLQNGRLRVYTGIKEKPMSHTDFIPRPDAAFDIF